MAFILLWPEREAQSRCRGWAESDVLEQGPATLRSAQSIPAFSAAAALSPE